jgi:hypothetical protein
MVDKSSVSIHLISLFITGFATDISGTPCIR